MSSKMKIIIVAGESEHSERIARLLALHRDIETMKMTSLPADINRPSIEDIVDMHQPLITLPSAPALTRKSPGKRRGKWSWRRWRFQ
jgi:hypothetical protein